MKNYTWCSLPAGKTLPEPPSDPTLSRRARASRSFPSSAVKL